MHDQTPHASTDHYRIHGHAAALENRLAEFAPVIKHALGEFEIEDGEIGSSAEAKPTISGSIKRYDREEVLRHLSTTAVPVSGTRDGIEIYQDNERFWLIDDRFGLVEINLLKSQWRCWMIDEPAIDPQRVIDMAVLWPIAHLLRGRGLCLLPATSVVRGEIGVMLISPLGIEGELSALLRAGFRVVGQSWTALRDAGDEVEMLHMPGRVERSDAMRTRAIQPVRASNILCDWVDVEREFCGSAIARGVCRDVILIEPGRRPHAMLRSIPRSSALPALRRAWPIAELHPHRVNGGQMPAKLSRNCNVFAARLSHRPQDLLDLLTNAQQPARVDSSPRSIAV